MAKLAKLKPVPEPTLHERMVELFKDRVGKHIQDPRKKRFFVAFLIALPELTAYDLDRMEATLVSRLGETWISSADKEAI